MNDDNNTSVAQLKDLVQRFVDERDWGRYHDPKNLAMAIAIEAAELMEHVQWLRTDELTQRMAEPAVRAEMTDELADILCFALSLANEMNIDVATAMREKMVKNRRKYPAEEFRGEYRKPQ